MSIPEFLAQKEKLTLKYRLLTLLSGGITVSSIAAIFEYVKQYILIVMGHEEGNAFIAQGVAFASLVIGIIAVGKCGFNIERLKVAIDLKFSELEKVLPKNFTEEDISTHVDGEARCNMHSQKVYVIGPQAQMYTVYHVDKTV